MCGICGTAGFVKPGLVDRMTTLLAHRGPDDAGVLERPEARVALGNRRLSILDLSSAGHMPMQTVDGKVAISYNGEIYNFRQLRSELEARGHRFESATDTEVVLRGWVQWGRELLPRLNGMFACAILDERDREPELVLARDRFGIKPLYYTRAGDRLLFASEVRSLLAHDEACRSVNAEALHRYLAFLSTPGPATAFDGILKLPPGHWLAWSNGRVTMAPYHHPRFEPERADEREKARELQAALARSVERHLIADVPVGVFLSGGLDSSLVAALATQVSGQRVSAYTIGFRTEDSRLEQGGDEDAHHARIVAGAIDAAHHEIVAAPDIADLLPFTVQHLEEPLADPAAISTYLICRAARSEVKVLLSGHGADELFAGYRVHRNDRLARALARLPGPLLNGPARHLVDALPSFKDRLPGIRPGLVLAAHRYLAKLLDGIPLSAEERYIFARQNIPEGTLRALYTPEFLERLAGVTAGDRHRDHFRDAPAVDFLNRVLYVDQCTYLPDHNLLYSDKMSAAASMELRVPFLDNEITELAARLPVEHKLRGLTGKHVLRRAARGVVPSAVIERRKAGFGVPVRTWLRTELRGLMEDLLSVRSVANRGYLRPDGVRRMVEEHVVGVADHTHQLWTLMTLEVWHTQFIDEPMGGLRKSPTRDPMLTWRGREA